MRYNSEERLNGCLVNESIKPKSEGRVNKILNTSRCLVYDPCISEFKKVYKAS